MEPHGEGGGGFLVLSEGMVLDNVENNPPPPSLPNQRSGCCLGYVNFCEGLLNT